MPYLKFHQNDYTVVYHHMELMEYNNSLLQNVRLLNVKPNRTFRAFSVYYKSTTDWFPKDISVRIIFSQAFYPYIGSKIRR